MTIQNFFTSRDNNANANTYVGQLDRLWYNIDLNAIYVSDGNTPGGIPVGIGAGANIIVNNLAVNTISNDDSTEVKFTSDVTFDDEITVNGNAVIIGNISPATTTKIGGVRAGPGANISNTGLLTIDTTGLPLSFGNFTANNNILTIVNADEDMILATQGSAEIQLVGNIGFYKSNGLPPDPNNQYFFARDDGQLRILVPVEDPIEGGVEIIGSATGTYVTPGAPGTMLQFTGNPDIPCRVYHDSLREYSSYVARRYNGTTAAPGQVLAGQDVFRINTTAATNAGMGNVAHSQIRFTALENQTTTAQGSEISFYVTAIGSPAASRVEVATITVADGITATKFTTAGTVTATGNITGGNLVTGGLISATGNVTGGNVLTAGLISAIGNITGNYIIGNGSTLSSITGANVTGTVANATNAVRLSSASSILAGTLNIDPAAIGKNTTSTQTFTLTGLTTNHKVIVMPQAALPYQLVISAAWASAADTLSIEFQNFDGGLDPAAFNIAYWAWV